MTIYPNMNKEERNRILQSRYSLLGIPEQSSPDGRLLYIPDLEDKMLYYENCENPELKMSIGNALAEMMGDLDKFKFFYTQIFVDKFCSFSVSKHIKLIIRRK